MNIFRGIIFSLTLTAAFGQDADTIANVTVTEDSLQNNDVDVYTQHYAVIPDSLPIERRAFNDTKLHELKADPNLNYEIPPTVAESLWDRMLALLAQFLNGLFDKAINTPWGNVLVYALGLALLVVVIMMLLKVNAFKIFYSGAAGAQQYQVLDENIHEMDFDNLIQQAIDQQDYRRGIRLLFLYSLKLLSDRDLIHWQQGKTNHDYVGELAKQDLKPGLNELSYYFDYAWYGNFAINAAMFNKVRSTFTEWRNKIS